MGIFPAEGVWLEASPAPGPLPVALFSHGHQGYAENSSFLMEHLASHGWLVLAPDHTGNTTFDPPDRSTEIYFQRPADLSAVLDHMAGLEASDPLAGLQGEPIVALGHSFGGYTVFALAGAAFDVEALSAACAAGTGPSPFCSTWSPDLASLFEAGFYDPRVSAFLPAAAGDSNLFGGGQGAAEVQGPVLMMTGDLDSSTPTDGEAWWAALSGGEHRRLQISGAGHQSFTDYAGLLGDAGLEGLIDEQRGWDIVNAYTLAWLRLAAGDTSVAPVLDGELTLDQAAQILR
jgi:predicted dienelactone hydrolase